MAQKVGAVLKKVVEPVKKTVVDPVRHMVVGDKEVKEPGPLLPFVLSGCPPAPFPAVALSTADEQHLQSQSERAKKMQELSEGIEKGMGDVKGGDRQIKDRFHGAWDVFKNFTHRSYVEVKSSASRTVRDVSTNHDIKQFCEEFRELAENGSVFISSHTCEAIYYNQDLRTASNPKNLPPQQLASRVKGNLVVSSTHLCFYSREYNIRDAILLKSIASIAPSAALRTISAVGVPYFLPLPSDRVLPNALQVFTAPVPDAEPPAAAASAEPEQTTSTTPKKDVLEDIFSEGSPPEGEQSPPKSDLRAPAKLNFSSYQFYNFSSTVLHSMADVTVKMNNVEKCFAALDRAWRAETTVPLEGVRYAVPMARGY